MFAPPLFPVFSAPVMMMYIIIFLKLWSYAQVNSWCRAALRRRRSGGPSEMKNLLLKEDHSVRKRKQQDAAAGKPSKCPCFVCGVVDCYRVKISP